VYMAYMPHVVASHQSAASSDASRPSSYSLHMFVGHSLIAARAAVDRAILETTSLLWNGQLQAALLCDLTGQSDKAATDTLIHHGVCTSQFQHFFISATLSQPI